MRFLYIVLLLVCTLSLSQAQERIGNVRVRALDSAEIEIRYDLLTTRPGDSLFFEVRSRQRGALTVRPEFVRGETGRRITAGANRRIVWNALGNGYALDEPIQVIIRVRSGGAVVPNDVSTQPTVAATPPPTRPAGIDE